MNRPTTLPDWATNPNYGAGSRPWNGQPNKTQPSAGVIAEGFDPESPAYADFMNWLLNNHGQWINYHDAIIATAHRGNGSDGAVTLDGTATVPWASKSGSVYTATRIPQLTSLLVTGAGVQLNMANFPLLVTGDVTTASGGAIHVDGPAATGIGSTQGVAVPSGSLLGGSSGAAGGGQNTPGNNASSPGTGYGGTGGNGGSGGPPIGNGGAPTAPAAALGVRLPSRPGFLLGLSSGAASIVPLCGGGGGGSGSGGTSGFGGAGGAGGGHLIIVCRSLNLAAATDIHCAGGAGGPAGTQGGGGGGGAGGCIELYYCSKAAGLTFSATANCPGGTFGAGVGVGGANGQTGGNGDVYEFVL